MKKGPLSGLVGMGGASASLNRTPGCTDERLGISDGDPYQARDFQAAERAALHCMLGVLGILG
jgi:hypothetical protein